MHNRLIFALHYGLKRLGPGSFEATEAAFSYLKGLPENPQVLDIGAGTGAQTEILLELCKNCRITAVDIHRPFLNDIDNLAELSGNAGRVNTVCASMDNLEFEKESFDIIWAEGSVFVMGFSRGISYWKNLLKPGGYLVLTDIIWFTDKPSEEALLFWNENYPGMTGLKERNEEIIKAGYEIIGSFPLSKSSWDNYLTPLSKNLAGLKEKYGGTSDGDKLIKATEKEIEMFNRHHEDYGCRFFILRKP